MRFEIEMKFTARQLGFCIEEVPIILSIGCWEQSKMSFGNILEAMFGVIRLKIDSWFRKYPENEHTIIYNGTINKRRP